MQCRPGCAACCIAPSITSEIPGMPSGKPSGKRCIQLDSNGLCKLFGKDERPQVCLDFLADVTICGESDEQAMKNLNHLEKLTSQ